MNHQMNLRWRYQSSRVLCRVDW